MASGFQLQSNVTQVVGDVGAALVPGAASPRDGCARRKLGAATRRYQRTLRCHWRAMRQGAEPPAPSCFAQADTRPAAAFAAVEAESPCPTVGDAGAVRAELDAQLAYLLSSVPALDCAEAGGAPACAGPCPAGRLCRPSGSNGCACMPAACVRDVPACGAACPLNGTCAAFLDDGFQSACRCVFPTEPCGDTHPVCNGTCPEGLACGTTVPGVLGACGCIPARTTACAGAGGFPTCSGSCPGGTVCAGVDLQVGAFMRTAGCACGNGEPCPAGGIACPPGQYCFGMTTPGFSLRECRRAPALP